ncbi:hypothetical protein BJY52DRAFT_1247194 [Lactarius psammicola]|nr:hypothetical protein BJY52DRAFT_1247194 [Lactarius psammicola]
MTRLRSVAFALVMMVACLQYQLCNIDPLWYSPVGVLLTMTIVTVVLPSRCLVNAP